MRKRGSALRCADLRTKEKREREDCESRRSVTAKRIASDSGEKEELVPLVGRVNVVLS